MATSTSERDVTKPVHEEIEELRMRSAPSLTPALTRELSTGGVLDTRQLSRLKSNPFIINDGTSPSYCSRLKVFDGEGYIEPKIPNKQKSMNGESKTDSMNASKKKKKTNKKTKRTTSRGDDSREEEMEEEHDSFSTDDDFFDDMEESAKLMEQTQETNQKVDRRDVSSIHDNECDGAKDKDCFVAVGIDDQNGKSIKHSDFGENTVQNVYVPSKVTKSVNMLSDGTTSTSKDSGRLSKDKWCMMKGETSAFDMNNMKKNSCNELSIGDGADEKDAGKNSGISGVGDSQRTFAFVGVGLVTVAAILASYSYRKDIRRIVRRATCRK